MGGSGSEGSSGLGAPARHSGPEGPSQQVGMGSSGGGWRGICGGFSEAVGNTPLIRLRALSELTGCEILGKAEFMNPGGSVKDRAALGILRDAERSGTLRPGGTVVEGTAGNTGIGLAHLCNARGYRSLIVIPDTQSAEKIGQIGRAHV